jgi:hypothetical protein
MDMKEYIKWNKNNAEDIFGKIEKSLEDDFKESCEIEIETDILFYKEFLDKILKLPYEIVPSDFILNGEKCVIYLKLPDDKINGKISTRKL